MNCYFCNSDALLNFAEEYLPCSDCNGTLHIEYIYCLNPDCVKVMRYINNTFFDCMDIINPMDIPIEIAEDIENIVTKIIDNDIEVNVDHSILNNGIYKCLECGSVCYKNNYNFYRCVSCEKEWSIDT